MKSSNLKIINNPVPGSSIMPSKKTDTYMVEGVNK